ncbi:MAG: porin [Methylophilaceae bacterium]|jgi:hypothetical protein|nr:hypothetical protein [Cycloclasticus sp.]HIL92205.1 hypothetical protein [Cycloclasticus sp.]
MLKKLSIAVLAFISFPSFADPSHAYANAVLEALQKKGVLSQQDVADIKQQATQAELQATKPNTAEKSNVQQLIAATKKSVNKASPNIKFWGQLQPRYTFVPSKNGLQGTNSFTLRRARVGFKGFAMDKVAFRFQYDASNEVAGLSNAQKLLDAWVSFKHFDDSIGSITVGQQFALGYTRRPHKTASVERKFTEVLSPGATGRLRGLTIRKGDMGLPETNSKGYFGNRLQYALGLYNGPDLSLNNDNNDLMFSAAFSLRPTGVSPSDDEYQFKDRPFAYSIGAAYSTSLDSVTLDTKFQPNGVDLDNEWLSAHVDVQAHHWWLWASWAQFKSDAQGGLAVNEQGDSTSTLNSNAFTLGVSRAYLLNSEDMGWAWALQYQHVNNEHPSRTAFFRPLTGKSIDEKARGMNQGSVYQAMFTWQFDKNLRLINELAYYDPTDGKFNYPSFISQLQLTF